MVIVTAVLLMQFFFSCAFFIKNRIIQQKNHYTEEIKSYRTKIYVILLGYPQFVKTNLIYFVPIRVLIDRKFIIAHKKVHWLTKCSLVKL